MSKKFVCTATEPIVRTRAGKLHGFYFDGAYTFHGIEYAESKRFMMPEPVKSWDGVKNAFSYGHVAPLAEPPQLGEEMFVKHRWWPESEHCQYLNVWTPSLDPAARKPVMVWLHGGGFEVGSSLEMVCYEGDSLCNYGDVVVVTLNHRLNILGYLDLSSFGGQYANSGNAGMADIVEALKWVQENISAFGGDPGNVTIFGQSGGGMKVTVLCQTPAAAGLFHKAIVMSGVIGEGMLESNRNDRMIVLAMLKELGLGPGDVSKLETLPWVQLSEAYRKACCILRNEGIQLSAGPTQNDWYPGDPLEVGFTESAKKIPTIVSTVIAEMTDGQVIPNKKELSDEAAKEMVANKYGDAAPEIIRLFTKAYPHKKAIDILSAESGFRKSALKYVEKKSAVAKAPVYLSIFAPEFDYNGGAPAWHSSDIPFVFHNTHSIPISNIEGATDRLEEQYCGAFVNFAHTGSPDHKALPHWPAYTQDTPATMVFDRECAVSIGYERRLMNMIDEFAKPHKVEMFLREDGLRCLK